MYSRISQSLKANPRFSKRHYTTEPQADGNNGLLIGGLLAAAGAGGYIYTKNTNHSVPNDTERNPMVKEKVTPEPKKSSEEAQFEQGSNNTNKDTSRLVGKDTDKVKKVWEDKNRPVASSINEKNEGQSIWNSLFGSRDKPQNPMVREKQTLDNTKPSEEKELEAHANENVHDTSSLVEKDTKKVGSVWNKNESPPLAQESKSFWSTLFGNNQDSNESVYQAKEKLNDVKEDTISTTERAAQKLSGAWEDVKETVSTEVDYSKKQAQPTLDDVSSKADKTQKQTQSTLNDVSEKASNIYRSAQEQAQSTVNDVYSKAGGVYEAVQDQGAQLTRSASNEYNKEKEDLNALQRKATGDTCQLKNQVENKTQGWYEKCVEQIQNGLDTVNTFVNNKESSNIKENFPASVVIEHARGKDM